MKVLKKNKGFTLVELIVVIAIIGILAAVLIPSIAGYIDKAKDSAAMQEAETIETAYLTWLMERDDLTGDAKDDFEVYASNMKLLSGSQGIRQRDEDDDTFDTGFIFRASNGIEVEAIFDPVTESITLTIIRR